MVATHLGLAHSDVLERLVSFVSQAVNVAVAPPYQPTSGSRAFFLQKPFSFVKYGIGSTRRFQHSFRRQTGHRCSGLASRSSWWLLPFMRHRKVAQWYMVRT